MAGNSLFRFPDILSHQIDLPWQTFPANSFPCCYKTQLAGESHRDVCVAMGAPGCSDGSSRGAGQWDGAPATLPAHIVSLHSSTNKSQPKLPIASWVCPKPATAPSPGMAGSIQGTAGSIQGTAGPISYRHCLPKCCCNMEGCMVLKSSQSCLKCSLSKGKPLLQESSFS